MMAAAVGTPSSSSFLPLLESLEDSAAGQSEQTDAYLTIANRLSGEEGRQFLPSVEKHFSRLGTAILGHITSQNAELSQAALQALGFCVYHSHVVSGVSETFAGDVLSALCALVVKSTEKNTCTRALWVISKQSFPQDIVAKKVPSILSTLENVWDKEAIQSAVMQHEALNVIIRMLEQVPTQMADGAVKWAKLVIPLVVHSASKVRLRAAAAMEMGMPLLLEKQMDVAAVMEPMMTVKLIPELQKLFMSKNETNVLKLWPLFVKLLGKLLHRGGPFINSLLHLEELGFRSSSPTIKKIAFIAWKSLIDNFALNPDILCSAKRMKLLMQPLTSINVRTEALLLTKVEVWWYLVVQLGPNLSPHFDQVSVPLLQYTIGSDSSSVPGTPARAVCQNGAAAPATPKTAGTPSFNSPANTSRMSLNSSSQLPSIFPSIQLLGLEMLLHYFLGPEVVTTAAKNKLILSLEPLNHPLISAASSFTKHAAVLISNIKDGFTNIGKDAPDALLTLLWTNLVHFVNLTIESGSKKDRQGCEVLTLTLQALQNIVTSEALPADRILVLFETTLKGIPHRVLGSASYQVGKMDVLNGTPALFLILLLYNSSMLSAYIEDERFYQCLETLVGCGLSGPTSPLAFGEAVLAAISRNAGSVQNKEQLWRMWSLMVSPLTDTITQSNEVNQGDALEHNFSAMHSALLFPITHLLHGTPLQQAAQKSMLSTWSKLYKVFARCSALVVTAEENICCEELCAKIVATMDKDALKVPSTLNAVVSVLQVMVECVDFSPYTPQFQQKLKSPHTPVNWMKKRNKALGNLSTFQSLLIQCLDVYLEDHEASPETTGTVLTSILSALFSNLVLANSIKEVLASLIQPLTVFYKQATTEPPKFSPQIVAKLEKLLNEMLSCLQSRSTLAYDDELLALLSPLLSALFPHKNKQLRTSVTHFWNSTFANTVNLTYPDELRPILSQVKQKTPIILPGFEAVSVPDELSGQYSNECSQLETKLSGMPVSSVGKRDSQLGMAADLKDRSSTRASKPVSTKLDFGSPKPPRREVLEEEASIDFVFIPPETKERVLTEHQKEMKKTKRVDIPAMYNNLDASLDTTVFSQYTQSQEDSMSKLATEEADKVAKEAPGTGSERVVEKEEEAEVQTRETQDYASPRDAENKTEKQEQGEMVPESTDVSMEDGNKTDVEVEDMEVQAKEGTSPNISGSSDLVTGTPQKSSSSRRQPFITLEKYAEGKPASPSTTSTFTGPLLKTVNNQDHGNKAKTSPSQASQKARDPNFQDFHSCPSDNINSHCPMNNDLESPRRPKDNGEKRGEPVRLIERLPNDATEDEDVIPDTQTEVQVEKSEEMTSKLGEMEPSNLEGELQQTPDNSQYSETQTSPDNSQYSETQTSPDNSQNSETQTSPGELRRSGRCRVRPVLPGEDPEEQERKCVPVKKRRSGEDNKSDSLGSSTLQSRPNTRSKQAAEEDGGRLRTRSQTEKNESSQNSSQGRSHKKVKLHSGSVGSLAKPENKRRSARAHDNSQSDLQSDSQSDFESQSQSRRGRRPKSSLGKEEESSLKVSSQVTREIEVVRQTEKDENQPKIECHKDSPFSQADGQSQEFELVQQTKQRESQIIATSPTNTESHDETSTRGSLVNESDAVVKDKHETVERTGDNAVLEDSQVITPSSSESQSLRRPRRSKASSDVAESEDKNENKGSSRRQSRSDSQANMFAVNEVEVRNVGRTRRSKVLEEQAKSSPGSTPESSQSLDITGSTESSQGRGKYSTRRSSQALSANMESSGSESSEAREPASMPKKRGRKPRAQSLSPLTIISKDRKDGDIVKVDVICQEADSQSIETNNIADLEESQKSQDLQDSESLKIMGNIEEQSTKEMGMEVEAHDAVAVENTEPDNTNNDKPLGVSPRKELRKRGSKTNTDHTSSQESDTGESAEMLELAGDSSEQIQENFPCDPSILCPVDTPALSSETTDNLQASESSPDTVDELVEPVAAVTEKDSDHQEHLVVPVEDIHDTSFGQNQYLNVTDVSTREDDTTCHESEACAGEDLTALQESNEDRKTQTTSGCQDEGKTQTSNTENDLVSDVNAALIDVSLTSDTSSKDVFQDSPVKQKDLDAAGMPDVVQSPISGRTRGTWSPSASPSTSILKKGQKRPLEEETPSPLVKSRRVSFANPIQQQEMADDIDRRSPAIRTSSPRRSKISSIPQPKYVTTPTKGLLVLSPRNLHSPGYKSSKKCLISEMGQEPRPVSKDCIYPALVGCSAPIEAVLPQISSNMWSRGFGQLVRARNIKTVGDLSALTPSEVKTLPIRSPKLSNVKKALKIYEQQRKGRGVDELKSFDEMEMMTADLEKTSAVQSLDEVDRTSGEALATELVDEPVAVEARPEQDGPGHEALASTAGEPEGGLQPDALLSEVEALTCKMTPLELGHCSPRQLLQMHDQLGGLMRRVVVELQARLRPTDGKP